MELRISAIVMSTASHDLVEFSDDGWAFRAYLVDDQKWRSVMQYRFIESAEILDLFDFQWQSDDEQDHTKIGKILDIAS